MQLRERYYHHGPAPLGDAELVALILGTGRRGHSALSVAADLLSGFGGLDGLRKAEPAELERVSGMGMARATRLHAALQLGARSLQQQANLTHPILDPHAAEAHLVPGLRGLTREELHGLYLDRRRRPLAHRVLTRGSDGFTVVDPRQVFRPAVALGASAVILAHNHPSGDPEPSAQDRDITSHVARAGKILGIPLLDHLVVGSQETRSLAAEGLLPRSLPGPMWTV